MTPLEIQARLRAFAEKIGGIPYVSLDITLHDKPVTAHVYPEGIINQCALRITAMTFEGALSELETRWAEQAAKHRASKVRRMALKIIEATAERGHCGDMQLRDAGFTQDEIKALGGDACEDANQIASNGPFAITTIAGANAA